MAEFKGTKSSVRQNKTYFRDTKKGDAKWIIIDDTDKRGIVEVKGKHHGVGDVECKANAELVEDAFNVRQQINCDLPELLRQRNELLEFLKEVKGYYAGELREKADKLVDSIV